MSVLSLESWNHHAHPTFRLGLFLTLLCLLARPALRAQSATVNDNDTGVVYAGSGWGYLPNRSLGDVGDDVHAMATNGDSVSYTFTGTDVSYVTETAPDEGNVLIQKQCRVYAS